MGIKGSLGTFHNPARSSLKGHPRTIISEGLLNDHTSTPKLLLRDNTLFRKELRKRSVSPQKSHRKGTVAVRNAQQFGNHGPSLDTNSSSGEKSGDSDSVRIIENAANENNH